LDKTIPRPSGDFYPPIATRRTERTNDSNDHGFFFFLTYSVTGRSRRSTRYTIILFSKRASNSLRVIRTWRAQRRLIVTVFVVYGFVFRAVFFSSTFVDNSVTFFFALFSRFFYFRYPCGQVFHIGSDKISDDIRIQTGKQYYVFVDYTSFVNKSFIVKHYRSDQ